jgi:hypothetical protein
MRIKTKSDDGWHNDADYSVRPTSKGVTLWVCPYYSLWFAMKNRVKGRALHKNRPTYINCTVDEDWKIFSKFKQDVIEMGWKEGLVLDKDILILNNKHYGKSTVAFVPPALNSFLTHERKDNTSGISGVDYRTPKKGKSYWTARIKNPITGKRDSIWKGQCKYEGGLVYYTKKHEFALWWADQIEDVRIKEALSTRFLAKIQEMKDNIESK